MTLTDKGQQLKKKSLQVGPNCYIRYIKLKSCPNGRFFRYQGAYCQMLDNADSYLEYDNYPDGDIYSVTNFNKNDIVGLIIYF